MKYALLIYGDQSAWAEYTEEEAARLRAEAMPAWIACFEELGKADPNMQGFELEAATDAKVVRVRNGERLVTDGPFAETKEQLGGFYLVECASEEEALEIARRVPASPGLAVEIRPVAGV